MKYNDDERYADKLDVDPWDYDSEKYKKANKKQQKYEEQDYYNSDRYNQHIEQHIKYDENSGHIYNNSQPQRYVEDYTTGRQDFDRKSSVGTDPLKQALVSIILGLISVFSVCFGFVTVIISIIGFIFGIRALKSVDGSKVSVRIAAIIGMVLCGISWGECLIGVCLIVFGNIN